MFGFVSKSKYDRALREANDNELRYRQYRDAYREMRDEAERLQSKLGRLLKKWNGLVNRINDLGGEEFLSAPQKSQFTADELNTLINLCHPDKHGGKESANRITAKLIQMRKGA
jgi:hypothetical protein